VLDLLYYSLTFNRDINIQMRAERLGCRSLPSPSLMILGFLCWLKKKKNFFSMRTGIYFFTIPPPGGTKVRNRQSRHRATLKISIFFLLCAVKQHERGRFWSTLTYPRTRFSTNNCEKRPISAIQSLFSTWITQKYNIVGCLRIPVNHFFKVIGANAGWDIRHHASENGVGAARGYFI